MAGLHLDAPVLFVTDLETSFWERARWGGGEGVSLDLQVHVGVFLSVKPRWRKLAEANSKFVPLVFCQYI